MRIFNPVNESAKNIISAASEKPQNTPNGKTANKIKNHSHFQKPDQNRIKPQLHVDCQPHLAFSPFPLPPLCY
ncbi:hypothetical protein CISIN_1g035151mg [Citrus sinensis]|uniref:Uncharacterized protein n=1 Tax=Citrus sinensis TaxID=2711 RepID=A0A067FPT3_CITSI|nr:hypothetical protein CISIN_1g035151mg [Citrus sinensis]